jgi:hypothetical protein
MSKIDGAPTFGHSSLSNPEVKRIIDRPAFAMSNSKWTALAAAIYRRQTPEIDMFSHVTFGRLN